MKRKHVIMIICIALAVLLAASFSFAWFADTMRKNAQIETYIHKSYFESGDGKTANQFQIYDPDTGAPLDPATGLPLSSSASQDNCAFEIKYPVQLYYFAWLQALGYFNVPDDSGDSIEPVYFYLSADLDMTGWILPQIGTQTYPFVGNFDGNGHTITNLTVQNIEGTDPNQWTDKPANINGLNIVGFFGVVGSLENNGTVNGAVAGTSGFTATPNYTYNNSVNEIKNFTLVDATVKTDLTDSLAGIAAGYVNGTMEDVKVVGGTLHSTATTALTYTVNLSDFGAVGFCTEPYKDSNTVTTLIVYDPQVYSNAGGYAEDQGNNWGNSINMQTMYEDLLAVYNGYSVNIPTTPAGKNTITVTKTDGSVTGIAVTGNGEPVSTTYAGGRTYNLKVVEKKDGTNTVSFFSLVERNASFMYLYGGKTYITETVQEDSYYIHTGEATPAHYLTLNAQLAIADTASQSTDARWIIKDGKIYTVRSKTVIDPDAEGGSYTEDWLYYLVKNASNQLEIIEVSQLESVPASVTGSAWAVGEDTITTGGYALVYKNGSWQLEQAATYITDNAEQNYLSLNNTPAIVNQTSSANATSWSKETSGTGFKLAATVSNTKYYLNCSSSGVLSVGTNEASATVWYEDTSNANQIKIYMLSSENGGYALYYDATNSNWSTTTYYIGAGDAWGGSIDMKALDERLYSLLNTNLRVYNVSSSVGDLGTIQTNHGVAAGSSSAASDSNRYLYHWYYTDAHNSFYTFYGDYQYRYYVTYHPNTSSVIYRLGGAQQVRASTSPTNSTSRPLFSVPHSVLPLLVDPNNGYETLSGNTGYIVGGSTGTGAYGNQTTVRAGSYGLNFIGHSISSSGTGSATYVKSQLEVVSITNPGTYNANNWGRIKDTYNQNNTNVSSTLSSKYSSRTIDMTVTNNVPLKKYSEAREQLHEVLNGSSFVHGLHFTGNTVSASDYTTIATAYIYNQTYTNYQLPSHSLDFNLKEKGYINFFAGSYRTSVGTNSDSFFSLNIIKRNGSNLSSVKEISKIYANTNASTKDAYPYVYLCTDNSYSTGSTEVSYTLGSVVFDCQYLWNDPGVANALYYVEIPANPGEYALGSHSGKANGTYLIYLDISTNAAIEGDSKIVESLSAETKHTNAGTLTYTDVEPTETDAPTYYPLAWNRYGEGNAHDYRGDLPADTNTGYVISGANTNSAIPGDIRVSQYTKYATGNWASIRNSLTSANNAGILNDARVYTIIDGEQVTIDSYGIGIMHTMQYGSVSKTVNALLQGNQYVYGLHFMNAQISKDNIVTVPKAIINGVTKTNYKMPQDSIDFHVATKGRIAFMAGTYYSGSNGVQSFFSLHRIFRDGSDNITAIKQLSEIYSDGDASHGYVYRYKNDSNYYNADGSLNGSSVPSGYVKVYDLRAIDDPNGLTGNPSLTQNSVYYFEIPVDAGEYALGSSDTDGAYLIYLDIAANASFAVQTCTTEVTEQLEYTMNYPKGIAFVDDKDSTLYDDNSGKADPSKSVFVSIPMRDEDDNVISSGNTVFDIDQYANMEVTNTTSAIQNGAIPQSIPLGGTLSVNETALTMDASKRTIIEKVTAVTVDLAGATTTTVTTTTYTLENGVTTVVVEKTETKEFNGTSTTSTANTVTTVQREVDGVLVTEQTVGPITTTPTQPLFDGDTLIPDDLTTDPIVKAEAIFKYSYSGNGLTNTVERDGDLNAVLTNMVITIDGNDYTVYDVEEGTGVNAGKYDVTISGTAGTYTVTVEVLDDEFVFTINNTDVASTGNLSVAVAAAPTP